MSDPTGTDTTSAKRRGRRRRLATVAAIVIGIWLVLAYLLAPIAWTWYTKRHPSLDDVPGVTHTVDGIPGDPLNVALVGTEAEVRAAMRAAGWDAADPLSLRSRLKIAEATVAGTPYDDAPVSDLFLFGRKEDLAFEQPVGNNPRQRHHCRFWRRPDAAPDGRPFWVGSATFDERVGLSRTTGEITHHIAPDIDTERDHLFSTLKASGALEDSYMIEGFHTTLEGRNGGGDPWRTDGALEVGVVSPGAAEAAPAPAPR